MSSLVHRFRRATPPSVPQRSPILSLPAELRLQVYHSIAPNGFLPYVHYQDYVGLFLSCKSIHSEMSYEALRAAPKVLQKAQDEHDMQEVMRLRPLRPKDFSVLMHITLSIPRWALFSSQVQEEICYAIGPILELHLSSLTIGLEDIRDEMDLVSCWSDLNSLEFLDFHEANHWALHGPGSHLPDREKYYGVRTTYADIVKFATRMNCLVAPNLCTSGGHEAGNHWCLHSPNSVIPYPVANEYKAPNVRKIVFRLKTLHNEEKCDHCGRLHHDVYPSNRERSRWHPEQEMRQLQQSGWNIRWTDERGKWPWISVKRPAMFKWQRIEKRGGVLTGVKALLKHE